MYRKNSILKKIKKLKIKQNALQICGFEPQKRKLCCTFIYRNAKNTVLLAMLV